MSESRPHILIVDDREQNRYVLGRVLRQAGYECTEAARGGDALAQAQSLPDVIILDVSLPDMSGYEVCRRIKRDPRTAQISILQISASFISSENKARALEAGADGYLIHPIDSTVLVATVRALLRLRGAEAVARQSAEQWQSTFDALREGLAFVSADGRLMRWNAAFAEICGQSCSIEPGCNTAELLEQLVGTSAPLQQGGPDRYRAEFNIGGRSVQLTVNPISPETAASGVVLVLSDVTDRQIAEYALRTAEKIAATGKLAHAIAHEINNPLESLTNLVYLAQITNDADAIHRYLASASEELARIARITRQTLSFHRDTHHPVPIDLGNLMNEVVTLFDRSAAARKVRVLCHQRPTQTIYGFPGQLSQVFGNLVRNAAEAAPPESAVTVRVMPVKRAGHEGTRITIHDRGSGIPVEVQKKLFDPFFTTKELRGSGLGLWVSKNLILKHNGTIRFRSCTRAGASGTTFEIFLPSGGVTPNASAA